MLRLSRTADFFNRYFSDQYYYKLLHIARCIQQAQTDESGYLLRTTDLADSARQWDFDLLLETIVGYTDAKAFSMTPMPDEPNFYTDGSVLNVASRRFRAASVGMVQLGNLRLITLKRRRRTLDF